MKTRKLAGSTQKALLCACRSYLLIREEDALICIAFAEKHTVLYVYSSTKRCRGGQSGGVTRRRSLDCDDLFPPAIQAYSLSLALAKLVLLAGDVESNPGPENEGSPPPAPVLRDLMHLRVNNWYRLGLKLKLDSYDLDVIMDNRPGDRNAQELNMFKLWLRTNPQASYEQLIKALHEVGDKGMVDSLCKKYGIKTPGPQPSYPEGGAHDHPPNQVPELSYLAGLPVKQTKWKQLGKKLGVPEDELDNIESTHSMFESWLRRTTTNECTYENLARALAGIGEEKLAAEVCKKVDFSDEKQPQLRELVHLPIKHKWKQLGLKLGLKEEKLDELTIDHSADADLCFASVFHYWMQDSSKYATRQMLIKALAEVRRPVAAYLCRKWGIPEYVMGDQMLPKCVRTYARSLIDAFKTTSILPTDAWPPTLGQHYIRLALINRERNLPQYEIETISKANRYTRGTMDKVLKEKDEITMSEIFILPEGDEVTVLKVLIDGAPGAGKTTLTRKICNSWANGELLQEYSLVILAHLRNEQVRQAKTVFDLLKLTSGARALDDKVLKEVNTHIVQETRGEDVLIIFDGYDELSSAERTENQGSFFSQVIAGSILPKCSVVVTSRPYASQNLQCDETFCRHVEVLGFSEKQIHSCVMQNIHPRNEATELFRCLEERLDLMALCYIPLNLAILLYVYKLNNKQLPRTITGLFQLFVWHTLHRFQKTDHGSSSVNPEYFDDLKDLPDALKCPFDILCERAYKGIENDQLSFDSRDCPSLSSTTHLGLLTAVTSYTVKEEKLSYQFVHLTVQEFLAAEYASLHLCNDHSKLFKNHLSNDRFRLVLLFLAGISKLEHVQIKDAFEGEIDLSTSDLQYRSNCQKFVLAAHIAYEAQNAAVCHNLARSLKDSELVFKGDDSDYGLTLFDYTVIGYFISNSCHSWKLLRFEGLTDRALVLLGRFPSPSSSKVVVQHVEINCSDCSVISVASFIEKVEWFTSTTRISISAKLPDISQEGGAFGWLVSSKLKCLEDLTVSISGTSTEHLQWKVWVKAFEAFANKLAINKTLKKLTLKKCFEGTYMKSAMVTNNVLTELRLEGGSLHTKEACNFFQGLSLNRSLKSLHINTNYQPMIAHHFGDGCSVEEGFEEFKKLIQNCTCAIEHLDLSCCGLTDEDVEHITPGLAENKSVVTINLSGNKITAKGCKILLESLSCKNVKQLILADMDTLTEGNTTDAGKALERYLKCNHTLTLLSFRNCKMDDTFISYLIKAIQSNKSLTELDISRQHGFSPDMNKNNTQKSSLNYRLLLAAQSHPTLQRFTFRQVVFKTFSSPERFDCLESSSVRKVVEVSGIIIPETFLQCIRRMCSGSEIWIKDIVNSESRIRLISELKETSHLIEMNILPITVLYTDADYLSTISKALPSLVHDMGPGKFSCALLSVKASSWDTFRILNEIPWLETGTWAKCTKISTKDCKLVFESLKKNTQLQELEIAKTRFGIEGARSLASLLNAKLSTFQINFTECQFCDQAVKVIAAALQENTTLVLSTSSRIKQFLCYLQQNSSFRKLHVSSSQILASDLSKFLEKSKYLSQLRIAGSHLMIDSDAIVCAILQSTSLTEVTLENLEFYPIQISQPRHECAVTETQLIKLQITNCELELKAWNRLFSSTSSLACFELVSCTLTDYEAMIFAEGLSKNRTLSTLKLRDCIVSDKGYTEIIRTAVNIPTLKVLELTDDTDSESESDPDNDTDSDSKKVWPNSLNHFCQCSQLVELQVENFHFSREVSASVLASLTQIKRLKRVQMCNCEFYLLDIKPLIEVTERINTVNVEQCFIERAAVLQFAKILQEEIDTASEVWVSTTQSLHIFVQLKYKVIHAKVDTLKDDHIQSATQMEWNKVNSYAAETISSIKISSGNIQSMVDGLLQSCSAVRCIRIKGLSNSVIKGTLTQKNSNRFTKSICIDELPDSKYSELITALKVLLEHKHLEEFTVHWKDTTDLKALLPYLQEHLSEAEFTIGSGNKASVVVKIQQQCSLKFLNIKGHVESLQPIAIANRMQSRFSAKIHDEPELGLPFEIDIHGGKEIEEIAENVLKTIIQKKCDIWVSLRGLSALPSSLCKSLIHVPLKMIEMKDSVLTGNGTQSLINLFESAPEVIMWRCNLVDADAVSAVCSSQTRFHISDTTFACSEHLLQLLQAEHISLGCVNMQTGGVSGMDYMSFLSLATSKTARRLSLSPLVKMNKNCVTVRAKAAKLNLSQIDISLHDVNFNAFCHITEILFADSVPNLKEIHLIDCCLDDTQCADLTNVLSKFSPNMLLVLQNCRFENSKTITHDLKTNSSVTMLHLCETDIDGTTASLLWQSFRGLKILKVEKVGSKDVKELFEILGSQNVHLSKVCITACPNLTDDIPALSTALCSKQLKFMVLNGVSTIPKFLKSCLSNGLVSNDLHSLKITFFVHEYRTDISSQFVEMLRYLCENCCTLKELSLCWKVEKSKKQAGYFYWSEPLETCLLMNFTLGNEGLEALARVLSTTSSTELKITSCYLTPSPPESKGWKSLSKSVHDNTDLRKVVMGIQPKFPGQHLDFTDILTSVLTNQSIVKLQTDNLNLELPPDHDRAKKITELLSANKSLTDLTSRIYSQGCITIFKGLTQNHYLKCLDISNSCSLSSEGVDALSNLLSENSTITKLNIAGCDFTKSELHKVAEGLKLNHVLESLTIGDNYSVAFECIFSSIWRNPKCALQQLCVHKCSVKGSSAEALSDMLCHNQSLIELTITNCFLQSDDWKCILSGMKKSKKTKLEKLHLNDFYSLLGIGNEGWSDLCQVVKSLHELTLTSCRYYGGDVEKHWVELFKVIQCTNTFAKLNISGSTVRGLKSSQLLSNIAPKLTQLNVCSSGCSELGLLNSLSRCKEEELKLKKLALDVQGSWETVDALTEVLSVIPTLIELSVTCKSFEPLYCANLFLALKQNSSLQKLCLRFANLGMAGSEALSEMIKENRTITQLQILECKFTDSELRIIVRALFCSESLQCFEIDEVYREDLEDHIQAFSILKLDGGDLDGIKPTLLCTAFRWLPSSVM